MVASKTTQRVLAATFVAIIAAGGLVQAVVDLRNGERPQVLDLFTRAPAETHLRAFEKELERRAWPAVVSRPAMQFLRYTLHADLGEKALIGRKGWLFYRPDVDFLTQPWPLHRPATPLADDPLPAIVAFRDALAARDIALLLVPVPGKPSVYPDRLTSRAVDFSRDAHHHTFFARLDAADIAYVDLYRRFAEARSVDDSMPLYLEHDTHWSPVGIALAAEAVANRLVNEKWATPGQQEYRTKPIPINRIGDVVRMVDAAPVTEAFTPESIVCEQVIDAAGAPYTDDPSARVLVLGDSFLRIFERDEPGSAGFIAHLAHALRQPLTSIVSDGGASTLVRQELQRKPAMLEGKRVVVWEFVERDLRFGMEGWKIVPIS